MKQVTIDSTSNSRCLEGAHQEESPLFKAQPETWLNIRKFTQYNYSRPIRYLSNLFADNQLD